MQKISSSLDRRGSYRHRRPFWFPASSFYILAAAGAIASFFLIWGILHEGNGDAPWIPAGIVASGVLIGAVVLREIFMRQARERFLQAQKRLDRNLKTVAGNQPVSLNKLTLEQNAAILAEIKRKSDAAKVLNRLSDGHWEVFEICNEYLRRTKEELKTVGVGSPRLPALRRGREAVKEVHRSHLLAWAEIEARSFTEEAKTRAAVSDKLETAQKALSALNSALRFYPSERRLIESAEAVNEFIASIKISDLIEQAERAAFKGKNQQALDLYNDALFFLTRENIQNAEREMITEKLNGEIEKLQENLPGAEEKKIKTIEQKIIKRKITSKEKND